MEQFPKVVVAVLVQSNEKYLLAKETLESGKDFWIVPGGKVEFGEEIEATARREIKEELGIDVELTEFLGFKEIIRPQFDYHTVIFFFSGKPLTNNIKTDSKLKEAKYFSIEEIKNLNLVDSARWLLEEKMKII
jgi:ADP-ribose pyrophosphatase YjhB (NUDIX family)